MNPERKINLALGNDVSAHAKKIIVAVIITLALIYPLFYMEPEEMASDSATGEIFDAQEEVEEKFPPFIHSTYFIIEAKDDDILTQGSLWELLQNENHLRSSGLEKKYLYTGFDFFKQ